MAGGAESAEKAWQWALPMSSVPLYVQQEEQHDKAHNDQAYCVKHAYNEIYLSYCVCHYFKNIARIANAVQVTICLLVSTSVY